MTSERTSGSEFRPPQVYGSLAKLPGQPARLVRPPNRPEGSGFCASSLMKECCVGLRGLEPRASSLSGTRSNRLSYNPMTCENRSGNNPTAPSGRVAPWFTDLTAPPSRRCYRMRPPRRYSVSLRVTSTPPTSREVRLYTTAPIVDIAVISTMLSDPSRAV